MNLNNINQKIHRYIGYMIKTILLKNLQFCLLNKMQAKKLLFARQLLFVIVFAKLILHKSVPILSPYYRNQIINTSIKLFEQYSANS
jgi:hypothetical protein